MQNSNKQLLYKICYLVLNLFEILALIAGLFIYTCLSTYAPWYCPFGIIALGIPLRVTPALLFIGLLLYLLGKKYNIESVNKKTAFYSAIIVSLPVLIDGELGLFCIIGGSLVCITLIIIHTYLLIKHIKNWR